MEKLATCYAWNNSSTYGKRGNPLYRFLTGATERFEAQKNVIVRRNKNKNPSHMYIKHFLQELDFDRTFYRATKCQCDPI